MWMLLEMVWDRVSVSEYESPLISQNLCSEGMLWCSEGNLIG
jgi:hypothetical protein